MFILIMNSMSLTLLLGSPGPDRDGRVHRRLRRLLPGLLLQVQLQGGPGLLPGQRAPAAPPDPPAAAH